MGLTRKGSIAALAVALCIFAAHPASADTLTFDLWAGNTALSGYTGPYGTVLVTTAGNSNTATVTFAGDVVPNYLPGSTQHYFFGDGEIVDLNVHGAFTASIASETGPGSGSTPAQEAIGTVDGLGTFNLRYKQTDGWNDRLSSITINLTNTSGNWINAADVLALNDKNMLAAAHIFVPTSTGDNSTLTGFAAGDGTVHGGEIVPEASTMALLAFGGLPVLFGAIRARKRS